MRRRRDQIDEQPEGAPAWMLSYGDMMSQILCFFIILVSMSTIRDEKFRKLMDSVRQAFGYELAAATTPGDAPNATSLWEHLRLVTTPRGHKNVQGGSETVNVNGRELMCRTVREGRLVTVGESAGFDAGSAEVPAVMAADLDALVALVRDYPNCLIVRGHVSAREAADAGAERDLSYRRAKAVADCMERGGIHPKRLRLSVCGGADPVDSNLTDDGRARNRRAEIIVSEELVKDAIPRRPDHD